MNYIKKCSDRQTDTPLKFLLESNVYNLQVSLYISPETTLQILSLKYQDKEENSPTSHCQHAEFCTVWIVFPVV